MGSFSAASRFSGQTPSAVSKQISHLEDHVGRRLLHRTKNGVSLTEEGSAFFEKCRSAAEKFQEAQDLIDNFNVRPEGTLRIASSVAFGKSQLIPVLPEFLKHYPNVQLSLELTDRRVDLEEEQFDVAINFAEQAINPNFIAKKVMRNERVLCASPAYIAQHGSPKSFSDLARFNCLCTTNVIGRNTWRAEIDGQMQTVGATGNFAGNSADAVYMAALAGMGIARLSSYLVDDKIAAGELVRLLPEYTQKNADVAVIFADKRNLAPKIRAFVEFMSERFSRP